MIESEPIHFNGYDDDLSVIVHPLSEVGASPQTFLKLGLVMSGLLFLVGIFEYNYSLNPLRFIVFRNNREERHNTPYPMTVVIY